jgi:hypothetical protein
MTVTARAKGARSAKNPRPLENEYPDGWSSDAIPAVYMHERQIPRKFFAFIARLYR